MQTTIFIIAFIITLWIYKRIAKGDKNSTASKGNKEQPHAKDNLTSGYHLYNGSDGGIGNDVF